MVFVGGGHVVVHEVPVFIKQGAPVRGGARVRQLVPKIGAHVAHHVVDAIGLLQGVDYLNPRFVLVFLQLLEAVRGKVDIDKPHLGIRIHLEGVIGNAGGIFCFIRYFFHHFAPGFNPNGPEVVITSLAFTVCFTAVPEAELRECLALGQHGPVVAIAELHIIIGDKGHNDGKEQQQHNEDRGDHRAFIFPKAHPGVLEVTNGLGFKLHVMQAFILLRELEFLFGEICHVHIITHFLDPILILGSINP